MDQGILSALSVVLIACPCALGLATPMAVWSALSRAGAARVIINGGEALERLAAINAIRLDKTGTLTTGQPQVLSVEVVDSNSRSAILATAVGLAKSSKHVFSEAIAKIGSHHRVEPLSNVRNIVGKGVTAASTGHCGILYLGSLAFLLDEGLRLTDPLATRYREAVERGAPVVVAGWDGHIQAIFELSEQLRPGVDRFVEACRKMNLDCAVLTGDHANRGQKLSSELDVSVFAELTPDAKVAEIRRAHERFGSVAMVGDGINDAPALAAADVGIAIGCGTEVSRESADACLLQDDLNQIPWLISLSRSTVRTIRMNLFWSFAYNIVGVGLAMTGRLNPIVAAAAMALSSGCVVASSLRLQRLNLGADSARSSSSRAEGAHEPGANSLIEDIADRSCLFAESAT